MTLHQDIEAQCHALKHVDPDAIDLEEVRMLLRRCQYHIELVETALTGGTITGDGATLLRLIDELGG